jgi:methanogenic corrinoid protein MtbC1
MTHLYAIQSLVKFTQNANVEDAVDYLDKHTIETSLDDVLKDILEPYLAIIGDMWIKNDGISLTDAYISSKIAKMFLERHKEFVQHKDPGRIAIMGNIKNDYHSSGRKLVIQFLEMDGWTIIDLGNDVAPEEFISCALENDIKFIGISAMLYENALHIKEVTQLIEENFPKEHQPILIAGGSIFNVHPSLKTELGIKYSASNAYSAKKLFASLYKKEIEL